MSAGSKRLAGLAGLVVLALGLSVRTASAQLPAIDTCDAAAAALGGSWTNLTTNAIIYNGSGACVGQVDAEYEVALWTADAFPNNQSSTGSGLTGIEVGSGAYVVLGVRVTNGAGDGNHPGYFVLSGNADQTYVLVCSDAAPSVCTTIATYSEYAANGDTLTIGVAGIQLYLTLSGNELVCDSGSGCAAGVVTDATIASGSAALGSFGNGSGVDAWIGNSFTAPSVPSGGVQISSVTTLGAGR